MRQPEEFFRWMNLHTHLVHGGLVTIMILLLAYVFYDHYSDPNNRYGH